MSGDSLCNGSEPTHCSACGREIVRTFIHPRVWIFGHAKGCSRVGGRADTKPAAALPGEAP